MDRYFYSDTKDVCNGAKEILGGNLKHRVLFAFNSISIITQWGGGEIKISGRKNCHISRSVTLFIIQSKRYVQLVNNLFACLWNEKHFTRR